MRANQGLHIIDMSDTIRSMRVQVAELTRTLGKMERQLEHQQSPRTPTTVSLPVNSGARDSRRAMETRCWFRSSGISLS